LGNIITGSTPATDETTFYSGNRLFVSPADLQSNRYVFKTKTTLTEKGFNKGRKIRRGSTYFVCIGSTIGKVGQATEDSITNQQINSVIPVDNDDDFVFSLLEYSSVKIKSLSAEQAVPIINKTTFSNIIVAIPNIEEQEKISSLFKLLDERIQTQRKIIEKLETLMKGNLEKIFRQKLRFKNKQGNYFSIWKTMKLDEICDIKKGEQLNKDDLTESGNYPCLNGGMSFSGYTDKFNSDENTITISEGGNSCGFVNFMKSKFWLGGHCYKVILKKDISKDFLFHLLKFYEREIMNLRVGSGLPNIQQKDLKNLQLLISEDIEEQNKIANFLSSIQEKTETEKQILEKLELQKKFLLGNLFI